MEYLVLRLVLVQQIRQSMVLENILIPMMGLCVLQQVVEQVLVANHTLIFQGIPQ